MVYMSLYIVITYKYTYPQITASSCYGNRNYVDGRAVTTEGFALRNTAWVLAWGEHTRRFTARTEGPSRLYINYHIA
jgi:hypothetical protein